MLTLTINQKHFYFQFDLKKRKFAQNFSQDLQKICQQSQIPLSSYSLCQLHNSFVPSRVHTEGFDLEGGRSAS
jgi:hypothetical protein